ncbi:WhiB family transcription factor [Mycobacterium phage Demsculpinboyz]|uniref:WhiB family transcription factor n=2 Tax=Gracegardnervirinae TaxID=2946632 RepID=A0A385E2B2_9CAUD|nr:WhiB family transcription factor [Mycobacterium phage Renaud18]YP_009963768.1 WhiB family transcription factor [Mycobacterium phage Demsculpinboyz]ATN88665.1 WhiB family transcription factor [Mycobacterium phage Demsculpinboyz]AXQ64972.1 WhiB family transcription factor [Mycobacterium phage Renaud18]
MTLTDLTLKLAAAVEEKHAWRDLARCAEVDPEMFFPEKGGSAKPAKRICSRCEVADECLEWALANRENYGVFGGLTAKERRPLLKAIGEDQVA